MTACPEPSLPALRRGDPEAWRALFERYAEPLFLFAYHRCGSDPAAAEDVRQETFITAIQRIDSYQGNAPLFGWLCGIARHKAADHLRHQGRETRLETENDDEAQAGPETLPDPAQPLPEEWTIGRENRAAVVEALWSLPDEYRQALVWRYGRGEPVEIVAGRLKRTYKAAESLLARARSALRERLQAGPGLKRR